MLKTKQKLISIFLLALLGLVASVSMTYAWLGISRVPFVSDVALTVMTESAILIAPDVDGAPGEWSSYLDASALLPDTAPLRPVTYTEDGFMKVMYAADGRTSGLEPVTAQDINVRSGTTAAGLSFLEQTGRMLMIPIWFKCGGNGGNVTLVAASETVDGQMGGGTYVVGAPVWNSEIIAHENGGHGSEAALRVGFRFTPYDAELNVTGESGFTMYEPNADIHADGTVGYVPTENAYGGPLIENEHLIIQSASSWNEQDPVLEGTVIYQAGEFTQTQPLFELNPSGLMKVDLYLWMEGQDADCIARAVTDAVNVAANFSFGMSSDAKQTGIVRR